MAGEMSSGVAERTLDSEVRKHVVSIGRRVKELRLQKELTQADLAELCGCAQSAIGRLESPENPPSGLALSTLVQVANALGATLSVRFD